MLLLEIPYNKQLPDTSAFHRPSIETYQSYLFSIALFSFKQESHMTML